MRGTYLIEWPGDVRGRVIMTEIIIDFEECEHSWDISATHIDTVTLAVDYYCELCGDNHTEYVKVEND